MHSGFRTTVLHEHPSALPAGARQRVLVTGTGVRGAKR